MPEVVFVYPIIRKDFVKRSLLTLFNFTKRDKFKVIIVDQSIDGLEKEFIEQFSDLYIRMKNQGFAKAANEGIIHALRWEVPYIAVVNDDTEFMYDGWLEDALEEFKTDERIVAVCPESPRVAGWGYGLEHGECIEVVPYKASYTPEEIAYLKQGDYDAVEIQSRHQFEIPKSFPMTKRGVVDGIAMWLPIFKREAFIKLGLFEERFVWGGGEDYEMLARAYSCAWPIDREYCEGDDSPNHLRMVSTMKSWVWHHWGKSKDIKETLDPKLFEGKEPWNDLSSIFPPEINGGNHVDPWGHWKDEEGKRRPFRRIKDIKIDLP